MDEHLLAIHQLLTQNDWTLAHDASALCERAANHKARNWKDIWRTPEFLQRRSPQINFEERYGYQPFASSCGFQTALKFEEEVNDDNLKGRLDGEVREK